MTDRNWKSGAAALALVIALPIGDSAAAELPRAGKEDQRVAFIAYNPHNVTRVVGALRSSTQIEFASDEEIVHVAIGNAIAWEVAPAGHVLFLKPREHHPATNLQVITSRKDGIRRSYQLEVETVPPHQSERIQPMLLVKFRYPADEALKAKTEATARFEAQAASHADRLLTKHQEYGPRNWAYTLQGSASYEPVQVFDNGKITTFEFSGQTEMPAIYLAHEDGREELIPKNVQGNQVMVHALSKKFVLRRGTEVLCVFNERYLPSGIATGTMTTSPNVERTLKMSKHAAADETKPAALRLPVNP